MARVATIEELSRANTPTRGHQSPKSDCSPEKARDDRMRLWLSGFEAVPGPPSDAKRASPGGPLSPTPPRHTRNSSVLSDEYQSCAQPNGAPESSSRQPARPRLDLAAPDPGDTARNVMRVINTSSVVKPQMLEHAQLLELLQTAVLSGHVVLVGAEEKWDPGPHKYLSSVTAAVAQHKTAFVALFRGWL